MHPAAHDSHHGKPASAFGRSLSPSSTRVAGHSHPPAGGAAPEFGGGALSPFVGGGPLTAGTHSGAGGPGMFDTLAKAMPFLQSDICSFACAPPPDARALGAPPPAFSRPPTPSPTRQTRTTRGWCLTLPVRFAPPPPPLPPACRAPLSHPLAAPPFPPPVPGVGKDCIGLFVENNPTGSFLTINVTKASSEEHDEAGVGGRTWHISEASGGFQTRTFPLPVAFNAGTVKVLSHKDGLCVVFPRALNCPPLPRPCWRPSLPPLPTPLHLLFQAPRARPADCAARPLRGAPAGQVVREPPPERKG